MTATRGPANGVLGASAPSPLPLLPSSQCVLVSRATFLYSEDSYNFFFVSSSFYLSSSSRILLFHVKHSNILLIHRSLPSPLPPPHLPKERNYVQTNIISGPRKSHVVFRLPKWPTKEIVLKFMIFFTTQRVSPINLFKESGKVVFFSSCIGLRDDNRRDVSKYP